MSLKVNDDMSERRHDRWQVYRETGCEDDGYRGVSSLAVVSKKKLVGIVTEKDLCTRVVAKGGDPEKVKVSEIMTQPVVIVRPDSRMRRKKKEDWGTSPHLFVFIRLRRWIR
jgi:CBS domain-containing protein